MIYIIKYVGYCMIVLSVFFFTNCSAKEEIQKDEELPVEDEIIISSASVQYFSEGMKFESNPELVSNTINFTSTKDWQVFVEDNWCLLNPDSGNAGEGQFSVSVSENIDVKPRETIVKLVAGKAEKSFSVIQEGAPVNLILSDNSELLFSEGFACTDQGDTCIVEFFVNCPWNVNVEGGEDWCKVSPSSGSAGNCKFTVIVDKNICEAIRNAVVILKADNISRNLTVTQDKKNVNPDYLGSNEDYDEEQGEWDE